MAGQFFILSLFSLANSFFQNKNKCFFCTSEKTEIIPIVENLEPFEKKLNKNLFKLTEKEFFAKIKEAFFTVLRLNKIDLNSIYEKDIGYQYEIIKDLADQDYINLNQIENEIFVDYILKICKKMENPSEKFSNYQEKLVIPELSIFEILLRADNSLLNSKSFISHWKKYSKKFLEGEFDKKYSQKMSFVSLLKVSHWKKLFSLNFNQNFKKYLEEVLKNLRD